MNRPNRVAVIGTRFGRYGHMPAFDADDRCDVVGICSTSLDRAQKIATEAGLPKAWGDWLDVIDDDDVDVVSIATPPDVQPEIALAAIEKGKAVFCEKPLSVAIADAEKLVIAANRTGVANTVNFEFPQGDTWLRARKLIGEDAIGRIKTIEVSWHVLIYANRMRLKNWKTDAARGGGALFNFVSHVFHYLELIGGRINRISAHLHSTRVDAPQGDTLVQAMVEFESGATGSIAVNTDTGPTNIHRVAFYGDKGTILLENQSKDYIDGFRLWHGRRDQDTMQLVESRARNESAEDGRSVATSRLVRLFVDSIESGVATGPTFEDALRVQRLLDAARRSHETRNWVNV